MAGLEPGQYQDAEDFILCLNDIVPDGSTLAQAIVWLMTAEGGIVAKCLKEIIIACSAGLEPDDVKALIVACIEGPDSPIDKAFLASVLQEGN